MRRRLSHGRQEGMDLPSLPENMEMAVDGLQVPTQQFVLLLCRCQSTKGLYISRFQRIPEEILNDLRNAKGLDIPKGKEFFCGRAARPLEAFDIEGAQEALQLSVSSDSLVAAPACPYCGSKFWAPCAHYQRVFCISGPGNVKCPWCNQMAGYGPAEESFQVGRSLG